MREEEVHAPNGHRDRLFDLYLFAAFIELVDLHLFCRVGDNGLLLDELAMGEHELDQVGDLDLRLLLRVSQQEIKEVITVLKYCG